MHVNGAPGVSACGSLKARARILARRSADTVRWRRKGRQEGDDRWGRSVSLSEVSTRRAGACWVTRASGPRG